METLSRDRHHPNFHRLETTLLGSKKFQCADKRKVVSVKVSALESVSTEMDKLATTSWVRDASDPSQFTVYGWKHTSNLDNTFLAQTAAVNILVEAITE